jgi:hypothetical protein
MHRGAEYPVPSTTTIKEGMVISPKLVDGIYQWVVGLASGAEAFIATQDSDYPAVQSIGRLIGISMSGLFTLETGYYNKSSGSFTPGAELSAYADDHGTAALRGFLKVAASTERVLAVVTTDATKDLHAPADGGLAEDSVAEDGRVVTIQTTAVSGKVVA